jgi:hypothetical protein
MPKVQMQRMAFLYCPPPLVLTAVLFAQFKVCRTSAAVSATTVVYPTYRGEREEPGRLASRLLRAPHSKCRTRNTPRRPTKSDAGEARPSGPGDPTEQRGHRRRGRLEEEGQAEGCGRRRSFSSDNPSPNCKHRYGPNCGLNGARSNGGGHNGSSCRRSPTDDTRLEQPQRPDSARGICDPFGPDHGSSCGTRRRTPVTTADTEEEKSWTWGGHQRGRRRGWNWWGSQWW